MSMMLDDDWTLWVYVTSVAAAGACMSIRDWHNLRAHKGAGHAPLLRLTIRQGTVQHTSAQHDRKSEACVCASGRLTDDMTQHLPHQPCHST